MVKTDSALIASLAQEKQQAEQALNDFLRQKNLTEDDLKQLRTLISAVDCKAEVLEIALTFKRANLPIELMNYE